MANDIHLFVKDPRRNPQDNLMGKLSFKSRSLSTMTPDAIHQYVEFIPEASFYAADEVEWAWLQARVSTNRVPPKEVGSVEIATDQRPLTRNPRPHQVQWLWHLTPDDLERIETGRDPDVKDVYFKVDVRGIVQKGPAVRTVEGDGYFEIPLTEWESSLKHLGYGLPPSEARNVGVAATTHPSWPAAIKRLEAARKHLRAGESYLALTSCLDQFSSLVSKPYMESQWLALLPTDPDQKRESVARLLAAHCTYLNRVGYHREQARPDTQDLQPMPLELWEAELAVAQSQPLMAAALRMMNK